MESVKNVGIIIAVVLVGILLAGGGLAYEYTMTKRCMEGNVWACMVINNNHHHSSSCGHRRNNIHKTSNHH